MDLLHICGLADHLPWKGRQRRLKSIAGRGSQVESTSAQCAGGLPIESGNLPLLQNVACRERDWPPCCIHTYTVYTPIGGKGRCHTRRDLQDHSMQVRKSAGKISSLDLKPMRKDTQSPKQEQSVAPQNGPWSRQKIKYIYMRSKALFSNDNETGTVNASFWFAEQPMEVFTIS